MGINVLSHRLHGWVPALQLYSLGTLEKDPDAGFEDPVAGHPCG